jgi:hypothetical protein
LPLARHLAFSLFLVIVCCSFLLLRKACSVIIFYFQGI